MRPERLSHPTGPIGRNGLANPQIVTGLTMMVVGLLIAASLLQSTPAQSKTLAQENATATTSATATTTAVTPDAVTPTALPPAAPQQSGQSGSQQPVLINGRAVFAVPIVTGPQATALLQQVQANDHAHVVHDFAGWGKAVSTTVSWFRCADILQVNEYRGSQVEVEAWLFLPEQERLEAQAACTL